MRFIVLLFILFITSCSSENGLGTKVPAKQTPKITYPSEHSKWTALNKKRRAKRMLQQCQPPMV